MRELNECKAEIFSRMKKEINEQKRKRKRILTYTTPLCICLVMLFGFSVWQSGIFKQQIAYTENNSNTAGKGDESIYTGALPADDVKDGAVIEDNSDINKDSNGYWCPEKDDDMVDGDFPKKENTKPDTHENSDDKLLGVKANKISSTAAGAKKYYDPALYDERTLSEKEAIEYLGLDFSGLNLGEKYLGIVMKNIITDKSGKTAYDTFAISFGENITMLTSKKGLPYDCLYVLETNDETVFTTVNNKFATQTAAIIGTDNDGFYYADFNAGNINYRVKMNNCNKLSEFYAVVKAIIELSVK